MAVQIQLKRDTDANWTSANTVLAEGEIGINTTTNQFKIGNGSTAWNSLSYAPINGTVADIDNITNVTITSASSGQFLKYNGSAWVNDAIDLATDTTGSFVQSLVAGTGVTLANNSGENATPTITVDTSVIQARVANVTDTEIGYLDGVTSAIQTQIDTKAPLASPTFTGSVTLPDNTVALGTKTTGDYVASLVAGTGVTLSNNSGETATPTIAIGQAVGTSASVTFANLNLTGDLTVSGTTTSINTETLTVDDNIIVLNNNATGAPSQNAGIEVERGSSDNVALRWNETSDKWEVTENGSTYAEIATVTYVDGQTITGLDDIGDVSTASAASGDFLKYNGSAWVNDPINLGTDTVGNYVNDITAGTGVTVTHTPGEGSSPTVAVDTSVIQARVANVTDTEIGYLDGVTSTIQTQLDTIVDYYITNSGSGAYLVNGVSNGIIHFKKGKKYKVSVNATGHPFWIQTVSGAYSSGDVYSTGITNGGTQNGMIFVELPQNAPDTLYYACQYHSSMAGSISTLSIEPDVVTQLGTKAPIASPTFTGTPAAPTATVGTNTTQVATTAFVFSSVDNDQFILAGQIF